jgi:phosphoserine phosphatase
MLELLAYLPQNGFKTFIVSGGTVEFIRTFAEKVYPAVALATAELARNSTSLARRNQFHPPSRL